MKQLRDAIAYRNIPGPPFSGMALARRFPAEGKSLSNVLRAAGPFVPTRDSYIFSNAGQAITLEDARILREHFQSYIDGVSDIGIDLLRASLRAYTFSVPILGATGLPGVAVDFVIDKVSEDLRNRIVDSIVASIPGHYGRCVGLAFSAYDFFLAGWPIPSDTTPPGSGPLRDYIWDRLIDSLVANGAVFLEWTMVLHILPVISKLASAALGAAAGSVIGGPIGAALGAALAGGGDVLGAGGADALLDKTREHWPRIKQHLDEGAAWPIGIIHGSNSSPVDQHQILAIGYSDRGDGTGTLTVWDNNWPHEKHDVNFDMRGGELNVSSTDSYHDMNDTKGIICEEYSVKTPPESTHRA